MDLSDPILVPAPPGLQVVFCQICQDADADGRLDSFFADGMFYVSCPGHEPPAVLLSAPAPPLPPTSPCPMYTVCRTCTDEPNDGPAPVVQFDKQVLYVRCATHPGNAPLLMVSMGLVLRHKACGTVAGSWPPN